MKDIMLIFDLDGTLWDSSENVTESWNIAIRKHFPGRKLITVDDMHSVMGKTMEEISDILFSDMEPVKRDIFYEDCMDYEIAYINQHGGNLFPDEKNVLGKLKDRGYKLAVVSNCQKGYIGAFMNSMNMSEFFVDFEEWGNTGRPKSENIRLVLERNGFEKGIYIGDTQKDGDSARAAGVPFILADYGYGSDTMPDGIAKEFADIPEVVEMLTKTTG